MSATNFFLRALLLLCVVCIVLCEHSKRDVRRIIIKDVIPRPQKKNHYNNGHGHRNRGRSHSHNHGRKHKGKKHKHSSEENESFGDLDTNFSGETSFEEKYPKFKVHKSHHQPKASRGRPSHISSFDYETSRPDAYRDDSGFHHYSGWTPLSSELIPKSSSQEEYRNRRKKRKDSSHRKDYVHALKPPPLEITTSYPFQFDTTTVFPQLNSFNNPFPNWNFNQKNFLSNIPLIGTIEHPNMQVEDNSDRLKNHRTSYEEAATNLNTFISVPDDSRLGDSKEESKSNYRARTTEKTTTTTLTTVKPSRIRGRGNSRGNKKH